MFLGWWFHHEEQCMTCWEGVLLSVYMTPLSCFGDVPDQQDWKDDTKHITSEVIVLKRVK